MRNYNNWNTIDAEFGNGRLFHSGKRRVFSNNVTLHPANLPLQSQLQDLNSIHFDSQSGGGSTTGRHFSLEHLRRKSNKIRRFASKNKKRRIYRKKKNVF